MNRLAVLPWVLFACTAAALVYVVIDKSVTIAHQATEFTQINNQRKALLLLAQRELMGSEFARVRSTLVGVAKTQGSKEAVLEKDGNLHFHNAVFVFTNGKLTAVRNINEFEVK